MSEARPIVAMTLRVSKAPNRKRRAISQEWILVILILITLVSFSAVEPRVLSFGNIKNISNQASYMVLFAAAQAVVILTRGFDLSLGTTVSLVSVVSAMVMSNSGWNPTSSMATGMAVGVGIGLAIGLVNGSLVALGRINPFVATLGMTSILSSLSATVSGGFPVSGLPESFSLLATAEPLGVPIPIWISGAALLSLHYLLGSTSLGRYIYIVGSNPKAALVAGIPTRRTLVGTYALCSVLAAIGAMLLTARTGSGEPNLGGNLTLETIAAAVLGGMRLRGGEGGMTAPLLGALFLTVLSNGMNLVQVDGFIQQICLGIIIITSLAIDQFQRAS